MNNLEDFVMPTQEELFEKLKKIFEGNALYINGKFILVQGKAPIMLIAHLDTVHERCVKYLCKTEDGNILMSPQGIGGDDRCGVYALVTIYEKSEDKPWLLFTCDEEIGGVGAKAFCKNYRENKLPKTLKEIKCLIEIDRKGKNDAVYYKCGNEDFENYITSKGYETNYGSYSDICDIAPELGVAAVNLSSGYYNAHTTHEYINRNQIDDTICKVVGIVEESTSNNFPRYEYIYSPEHYYGSGSYYGYGWHQHNKNKKNGAITKIEEIENEEIELENKVLDSLPDELIGPYEELLDYHSISELEAYREEYGDNIIYMLYESEFGYDYYEYYNDSEEYEEDEYMIENNKECAR